MRYIFLTTIFFTLCFSFAAPSVMAATYTVINTNDSGQGSLREAIATANSTSADDLIVFDISNCPNGVCTIVLTSGQFTVSGSNSAGTLTISNPSGPGNLIISGNNASRIFFGSSNLTLYGLTLENGFATGGAAILSGGSLNVLNSVLRYNSNSSEEGGTAIEHSAGSLLISGSEITDNPSGYCCATVYALDSQVTIRDSTFANNGSGGFELDGYDTTPVALVSNSTFSGNSVAGAITMNQGIVYLTNSTITLNWAGVNAGWFGGTVYVRNNIISGNTLDFRQNYLYVTDLGNNVIGGSPLLGPLASNGGPTRTHALLTGSPAINAGNNCVLTANGCGDNNPALTKDQRGQPRNGTVDIGAYELQPINVHHSAADFDGDGRTDISVFRPSRGAWYLQQSTAGLFGMDFGYGTDKITPADYDGDGKTDIAVYRPETGIWYIFNSSTGTVTYHVFGIAEDLPTPADYDGDGRADISVFRPSTGTWYRQNSSDGSFHAVQFGASEDKPTIGDFDGDGKADIAVFRPTVGDWYQIYSSDGSVHGERFGFGTDVITQADYDGDGKTDLAVFRPSNGFWYVKNSNGSIYTAFPFGLSDDIPAAGDFDGDGKADLSVFRPSDGTWYRTNSSDGSFFAYQFGTNGDKPTQTAFRY